MSKKRHTRTPWRAGAKPPALWRVKKRHPHAHSPGNFKELKRHIHFSPGPDLAKPESANINQDWW